MKNLLCVLAMVALAGCRIATEPDVDFEGAFLTAPVEVTLQHGETRAVEGTLLRVTFAAVLEGSRCPADVVCVWKGNGRVQVGIGAGTGPTFALQLNTSLEPRAVDWNEVLVTLLELTPAPVSDTPIEVADYAVRLRLEPVS